MSYFPACLLYFACLDATHVVLSTYQSLTTSFQLVCYGSCERAKQPEGDLFCQCGVKELMSRHFSQGILSLDLYISPLVFSFPLSTVFLEDILSTTHPLQDEDSLYSSCAVGSDSSYCRSNRSCACQRYSSGRSSCQTRSSRGSYGINRWFDSAWTRDDLIGR